MGKTLVILMTTKEYTFYQEVAVSQKQYYHLLGNSIESGVQELFHYTSMSSFISILKESHIELWASRFDSMNDPLEFRYAVDHVFGQLGIHEEDVINCYPYIISFGKERDDLNLWRLYHSEICLVFDINKAMTPYIDIESEATCFQDIVADSVSYYEDSHDMKSKYEILKSKLLTLDDSYADEKCEVLSQYALALLKPDEFKVENEYRIIIPDYSGFSIRAPQGNNTPTVTEMEKSVGIQYRTRNGDILQYKPMKFPKDALSGVIINERDEYKFSLKKQHVLNFLRSRGYDIQEEDIVQTSHHFIDIHY